MIRDIEQRHVVQKMNQLMCKMFRMNQLVVAVKECVFNIDLREGCRSATEKFNRKETYAKRTEKGICFFENGDDKLTRALFSTALLRRCLTGEIESRRKDERKT